MKTTVFVGGPLDCGGGVGVGARARWVSIPSSKESDDPWHPKLTTHIYELVKLGRKYVYAYRYSIDGTA